MIEIYEGRLGGGKTYSATVRAVDHLRRGGIVCSNVEFKWDAIKKYVADKWELELQDDQWISIPNEQIGNFHRFTPSGENGMPVLVIVDEAHLYFNSRDWSTSSRELLAFLTQSRKVHTDVIFISQSQLNMDKQFARLVQYIWRFRDLSKWKIPGLGINYPFQQILCCQYDYDGTTQLQRSFIDKDKKVFGLYNTNSLLREFPRLQGVKTKRSLNKIKRQKNMVKILLPLGLIIGIICAFVLKDKIMNLGKPEPKTETVMLPLQQQTPMKAIAQKESAKEPEKKKETLYDIYDEQFRAWNGPEKMLATESGWYQVGEMSNHGLVTAVSSRRARIVQPDGRTGWVVANERKEKPISIVDGQRAGESVFRTTKPEGLRQDLAMLTPQVPQPSQPLPEPQPQSSKLPAQTQETNSMQQRRASMGIPLNRLDSFPHQVGGPR